MFVRKLKKNRKKLEVERRNNILYSRNGRFFGTFEQGENYGKRKLRTF